MKVSYNWLQDYIEEKLPEPKALAEKIIFGAFEVEEIEKVGDDTVFEIKVLPDRAHDCLSHYGIAHEASGLLGLTLKPLAFKTHEPVPSDVQISVKTPMCRRYIARRIFDVRIKESPEWLKARLESIGQRSINNVVDATNYVMFSLGQPMHAFDYDKVKDARLIVRNANEGERITTLDGKEVALLVTDSVIADTERALAIAGVKGGNAAEVTSETRSIIIEVANFDPVAVRKTARRLNLLTDSAKRFENELTPHQAGTAIHTITDLIVTLAGGQPEQPVDEYPNPVAQHSVFFTTDYINGVLGTNIETQEITDILNRYGYSFEEQSGEFKALVPYERLDIVGPHDMVEEIGRAYGYENIAARLPDIAFVPSINEIFARISAVRNHLVSTGYSEVMTYTFVKKGDFEVARGPVGKSALRKNLSVGLTESYELNKHHAALLGLDEVKIFEIGTVFPKTGEETHVATADNSGIKEMKLEEYPVDVTSENSTYNFTGKNTFKMWSEYPYITRDIALWIPSDMSPEDAKDLIKKNATELLVGEPHLFDTFTKDGRTSAAYRLVFQSWERTLTADEVDAIMGKIYEVLKERAFEIR